MNKVCLTATILSVVFAGTAFAAVAKPLNHYELDNFVANQASYGPSLGVEREFINAWGLAIRPKGAGGHFWVTAKDISYEYIGDVRFWKKILRNPIGATSEPALPA